jgi:hypothetical protein
VAVFVAWGVQEGPFTTGGTLGAGLLLGAYLFLCIYAVAWVMLREFKHEVVALVHTVEQQRAAIDLLQGAQLYTSAHLKAVQAARITTASSVADAKEAALVAKFQSLDAQMQQLYSMTSANADSPVHQLQRSSDLTPFLSRLGELESDVDVLRKQLAAGGVGAVSPSTGAMGGHKACKLRFSGLDDKVSLTPRAHKCWLESSCK